MLNDQVIAANYLIDNKLSSKIMIIDLDIRGGNCFYISRFCIYIIFFMSRKNYPFRKQKSDFDLAFEDDTNDAGISRCDLQEALTSIG